MTLQNRTIYVVYAMQLCNIQLLHHYYNMLHNFARHYIHAQFGRAGVEVRTCHLIGQLPLLKYTCIGVEMCHWPKYVQHRHSVWEIAQKKKRSAPFTVGDHYKSKYRQIHYTDIVLGLLTLIVIFSNDGFSVTIFESLAVCQN